MRLLHIDSSILGESSASRQLSREIVARWQADRPDLQVKYRDLAAQALPHLSGRSLAQADEHESAANVQVLEDFLAADVIVIGAPMYNFGIPSQLKAWIDRIVVAGKTFRYGTSGPEGLAKGKQVIVAASRGGVYAPGAAGEFAEAYLRFVFGFIGIQDITFVRAEGLALSPEHRARSLRAALATISAHAIAA
ncbi:MAG TPA: NAD(P)H-dependent oxidoreductase [Steroidobacteraceae bacterium]|jgi:FMN-dependent NADH-azoreductase